MVTKTDNTSYLTSSVYLTRNLWSGILFGLGLVAFIDEAIFHQLLHWHHFYDKSTTDIGLISDGLFMLLVGLQRLVPCLWLLIFVVEMHFG